MAYELVAGMIPRTSGWLLASAKLRGSTFAPEDPRIVPSLREVLDEKPSFYIVALHAPIGYLDAARPGGRSCDREARHLLGGRRGSSVHSAPSRVVVETRGQGTVDHLDAVSRKLLPRYQEVASEMAPYLQRVVYEVHPELSFYVLNGEQPLVWPKRFDDGQAERRRLLEKRIQGVERILDASLPGVSAAHLLDAAAILWTARRIASRSATRLPTDPEWDSEGLRMEIVR
jgi:predicted RNase H-like nuclease